MGLWVRLNAKHLPCILFEPDSILLIYIEYLWAMFPPGKVYCLLIMLLSVHVAISLMVEVVPIAMNKNKIKVLQTCPPLAYYHVLVVNAHRENIISSSSEHDLMCT